MADEKKRLVDDESGRNTTWGNLFLLCLFLLCEVAAFVSVTLWQENSLQTFTLKIENGNRLLNELEDACVRKESGYEAQVGEGSRVRRQSLHELFDDLLQAQEQILTTVCVQNPNLCEFGQKGDTGESGENGQPGDTGQKGETGPAGVQGDPGSTGDKGDVGIPGPTGPQGPKGRIGLQGLKGGQGDVGGKGDPGDVGTAGQVGQVGAQGPLGDQGPAGTKGAAGGPGETGPKGETGDAGQQGPQGDPGDLGPKGVLLEGGCLCVDIPTVSGNFSDEIESHLHQSFTLHCDPSDPTATVTWQRTDGTAFSNNVRAIGSDIIFSSVTDVDMGVYQCVANSQFGAVSKEVEVKLVAPSPYDCDFEVDTCSWTNVNTNEVKFQWTQQNGPTPSAGTGPTVDHTIGNGQGKYMFIESSGARVNGDNARLESQTMDPSQAYCLTFWYHLYGSSIGALNVRMKKNGVTGGPMWTMSGPSEDLWKQAVVNIAPQSTPFTMVIEGIRGVSYNGDAGVDDIVVQESPCP